MEHAIELDRPRGAVFRRDPVFQKIVTLRDVNETTATAVGEGVDNGLSHTGGVVRAGSVVADVAGLHSGLIYNGGQGSNRSC